MIVLLPWHCLAGSDAGHDHAAGSWRGHRFEGPFPELLKELLFSLLCARHAWLSSGAAPIALQGAEIYIQGWALTGAGWHQPSTTRFGCSGRGKRTMEARTTEPTALGEPVVRVCFAFCPALPACELVQARSVLSPLQCDVQPGWGGAVTRTLLLRRLLLLRLPRTRRHTHWHKRQQLLPESASQKTASLRREAGRVPLNGGEIGVEEVADS